MTDHLTELVGGSLDGATYAMPEHIERFTDAATRESWDWDGQAPTAAGHTSLRRFVFVKEGEA